MNNSYTPLSVGSRSYRLHHTKEVKNMNKSYTAQLKSKTPYYVTITDDKMAPRILSKLKELYPKVEFHTLEIKPKSLPPYTEIITLEPVPEVIGFLKTLTNQIFGRDTALLEIPIKELKTMKYLYERGEKS